MGTANVDLYRHSLVLFCVKAMCLFPMAAPGDACPAHRPRLSRKKKTVRQIPCVHTVSAQGEAS